MSVMQPTPEEVTVIINNYQNTLQNIYNKNDSEFIPKAKYHNYSNSDEVVRFITEKFNLRPDLYDTNLLRDINSLYAKLESKYDKTPIEVAMFYENVIEALQKIHTEQISVRTPTPSPSPVNLPEIERPSSRTRRRNENASTIQHIWQQPASQDIHLPDHIRNRERRRQRTQRRQRRQRRQPRNNRRGSGISRKKSRKSRKSRKAHKAKKTRKSRKFN